MSSEPFLKRTAEPLYYRWHWMRRRCSSDLPRLRRRYKDRGITVCDEWQEFMPFFQWAITHGFQEDLELDRIDGTKGYSPENCRWVTRAENVKNREYTDLRREMNRRSKPNKSVILSDGRSFPSVAAAARALGVHQTAVSRALHDGHRCAGFDVSFVQATTPQ